LTGGGDSCLGGRSWLTTNDAHHHPFIFHHHRRQMSSSPSSSSPSSSSSSSSSLTSLIALQVRPSDRDWAWERVKHFLRYCRKDKRNQARDAL
jgi:hypothetical protein